MYESLVNIAREACPHRLTAVFVRKRLIYERRSRQPGMGFLRSDWWKSGWSFVELVV